MNIPKLRFKEFNDEWVEGKISDLIELNPKNSSLPESFIYIDLDSVSHGRLLKKKVINRIDAPSRAQRNVKLYDILYQTVRPYQKNNLYIDKLSELPYIASTGYAVLREKNIYSKFLFNKLYTYNFVNEVLDNCTGTSYPAINANDLGTIKIYHPSNVEEQRKIGDFLSLLDKKIELQTKKIEALKLFKKGLFDTQLKTNEKELIMFDDFLDEATEKSSIQNQYPVLSSTSKGLFLQSDYFKKQASSENNVGYKILKRNQLVLSPQNLWMGNININNIFDIGIVSPSYRVYNIDIKKIDLNYFNYWIKTPKALYSYLISSEQGASIVRRNLNIEMFNQISLKVPKLEKQHIIGNKIYQFNLKINFEEEKLKQLHKLKKALLQNMFI